MPILIIIACPKIGTVCLLALVCMLVKLPQTTLVVAAEIVLAVVSIACFLLNSAAKDDLSNSPL